MQNLKKILEEVPCYSGSANVLFNHPKIQTSGTRMRIPPLISFSAGNVCSKQICSHF